VSRPSVSVVIPTYQRLTELPDVVEPVLRDPVVHEVVVAVDGSTDGSWEWLLERRISDRRLVPVLQDNAGIAAARQTGAETATGDVLLFLDDDVIPSSGLAPRHAERHAHARELVVQGYMPNDWRHLPPGRRGIALIYRRAYERTCRRYERQPEHILLGFWAGNFSMLRAQALRIGLASPASSHIRYQDDREFGIRCHRAGLQGRFDRTLLADHRYDRDLDGFRRDSRRQGGDRCLIHELHGDVVGPWLQDITDTANVADLPGQGLPRALRPLWARLAGEPFLAAFRAGIARRSLRLETGAARALGSLEVQRGVLEHDGDRAVAPGVGADA
jgi:glycosyltransferase involved in cell wall biosynthesis